MSNIIRSKALRQDLTHWDGVTKLANRKDQTGGTIAGLVNDYMVDVLITYGNGVNYTRQTIVDCTNKIGSSNVTLVFNPGTWVIDDDLTIGSNFTCFLPSGVVFNVSSGKTLTFNGPVIRHNNTWTSGSGTVTENGTRYFSGLVNLSSAVLQGGTPLVFEGATADGFETSFVIIDPTADRVVTFPDSDVDFSSIPTLTGSNTWSGINIYTSIVKWAKAADVASANALTLGNDGNAFDITGTTSITSIATKGVGTWVLLQFDAALTLTHHATDLILPGGENITTAAGDIAVFYEYDTGDWRCISYSPNFATQAEMEAASSNSRAVTPGRLQNHPGVAKVWCRINGQGTAAIIGSYNMTSITDHGTGEYTFTFATDFADTNYGMVTQIDVDWGTGLIEGARAVNVRNVDAGSTRLQCSSAGTPEDPEYLCIACFGDQ